MGIVNTTATVVASVAGALFVAWPIAIWWEIRRLEKPKYVVVKPLTSRKSWLHSGHVAEVRKYAPYVIAEVAVQADNLREAGSKGFMQVANFIFGGNTKKDSIAMTSPVGTESTASTNEKIAMTSPVGMDLPGGTEKNEKIAMTAPVGVETATAGEYKVWFMMPSKYTLDNLPTPDNPSVTFREVPGETLAAISFPGFPEKSRVEAKKAELLKLAKDCGITLTGDAKLWQYHPPFAVPWQRRNEVLLEVQGDLPQE